MGLSQPSSVTGSAAPASVSASEVGSKHATAAVYADVRTRIPITMMCALAFNFNRPSPIWITPDGTMNLVMTYG